MSARVSRARCRRARVCVCVCVCLARTTTWVVVLTGLEAMLGLEAEVDAAVRVLERAELGCVHDAQRTHSAATRDTLPFKFLLVRSTTVHPTTPSYTLSFAVSCLMRNVKDIDEIRGILEDRGHAHAWSSRLRARDPFRTLGASERSPDIARAVFAALACDVQDHQQLASLAEGFVQFWTDATGSTACSVDALFPAGMPPLECRLLPFRTTRCSNVFDSKLFLFRLRSVIDGSASTLNALLLPCGRRPIPTAEYFGHLELVYLACERVAALQGVAAQDARAFTLASLCSAVDPDSFASLIESCKHALVFEQPRGAASFVWVAARACFHNAVGAADGALASAIAAQLGSAAAAVDGGLRRLACLAVSTRARMAFDLLASTEASRRAACSETRCLDVLACSPSGLLGVDGGAAGELFRCIASSVCVRGSLDECAFDARLRALRRFVSIDDALVADDALESVMAECTETLEAVLLSRMGPIVVLGEHAALCEHAKRARAFRRKTIAAVCDAFRCRVAAQTAPPRLVAWLSRADADGVAIFARGFASGDAVDEVSVCLDFEDELRRALCANAFAGGHGSVVRANLAFPRLDTKTTRALETAHAAKHGITCSRVRHVPLNGHAVVSVVCV